MRNHSHVFSAKKNKHLCIILIAHHSEEFLWQRIVGEKVKLGGVWCEGRVGGRRIVEPSTQRQVFSKKLHIVLYPLKRLEAPRGKYTVLPSKIVSCYYSNTTN